MQKIIEKYPKGKQKSCYGIIIFSSKKNNNWIPLAAMKYMPLDMPYIKVMKLLHLPV